MANIVEEYVISLNLKSKLALEKLSRIEGKLNDLGKEGVKANKDIQTSVDKTVSAFGAIRNQVILLGGAFISLRAIKNFFTDAIDDMAKLGYASDTLGMTTERLEALQLAAEKLGGSKEGITSFINSLVQSNAELAKGDNARFRAGNINSFLANGGNLSAMTSTPERGMAEVAKVYNNLYSIDPSRALDFAHNFGISEDNLPLLRKGADGIRELLKLQEQYAVTSHKDAESAQAFNLELLNIQNGFNATGKEIIQSMFPAMQDVILSFKDLSEWFKSKSPDISKKIGEWAKLSSEFIKALFGGKQNDTKKNLDDMYNKFINIAKAIDIVAQAIIKVNDFLKPTEEHLNEAKGNLINAYDIDKTVGRNGLNSQYEKENNAFAGSTLPGRLINRLRGKLLGSPEEQLQAAAIQYGFNYQQVRDAFFNASKKYNLNMDELMAQSYAESAFNPNAGSNKGAVGIAQFIKSTASQYGLSNRRDPVASIWAMAHHKRDLLNKFGGKHDLALAGYNAGAGAVLKYGGMVPNYPETINYIARNKAIKNYWDNMPNSNSVHIHGDVHVKSNNPDEFAKNVTKAAPIQQALRTMK